MQGYPFIFTKNPRLEFASVVLPSFVNDYESLKIIGRAAMGFRHQDGEALYLSAHHSKMGVMDIVFRVRPLTGAEVGEPHRPIAKDHVGRPIHVTEGFVLRERTGSLSLGEGHWEQLKRIFAPKLQEFWKADTWSSAEIASDTVVNLDPSIAGAPLHIVGGDEASLEVLGGRGPHIDAAKPSKLVHGPVSTKAVVITGAALAAVAVGAWLIAHHQKASTERSQTASR